MVRIQTAEICMSAEICNFLRHVGYTQTDKWVHVYNEICNFFNGQMDACLLKYKNLFNVCAYGPR